METLYRTCQCCGNYFLVTKENVKSLFCSKECCKEFVVCFSCGNYFHANEIDLTKKNPYCGKCSEFY